MTQSKNVSFVYPFCPSNIAHITLKIHNVSDWYKIFWIEQAWINWHNLTKMLLKTLRSAYDAWTVLRSHRVQPFEPIMPFNFHNRFIYILSGLSERHSGWQIAEGIRAESWRKAGIRSAWNMELSSRIKRSRRIQNTQTAKHWETRTETDKRSPILCFNNDFVEQIWR